MPRILQLAFGRWYIVHPILDGLAWSGQRWVRHVNGVTASYAQICNFESSDAAWAYLDGPALTRSVGPPGTVKE